MIALATGLYWIAVGLLCLGGSALVAHVLRRRGHQERGAWALGLLGALTLPLVLPMVAPTPGAAGAGTGFIGSLTVLDLSPVRITAGDTPLLPWLGPVLLAGWAGLSGLFLLRLVVAVRAIGRLRDRTRPARVAGGIVRVTDDRGPAVVGFLNPVVLVPEWVLDLPANRREWILRHEEEHIRGRDPWLLGFVLLARVAVPWNPVVWWFGWSIRSAIETDCDRRTVGPRGDVRSYGEALISVASGAHRGGDVLPSMAPAFAEQHVPLDHRIEAVTTQRRPVGGPLRVALASVAVLVVGAACEMPAPTGIDTEAASNASAVESLDAPEDRREMLPPPPDSPFAGDAGSGDSPDPEPRFIPYDTPPRLTNPGEVQQALEASYPPLLKESGIGGEVIVWLYISEDGDVLQSQVREAPPGTSGHEPLDAAAIEVADAMVFEPAMNRDKPTAVWVQIPITFTVGN